MLQTLVLTLYTGLQQLPTSMSNVFAGGGEKISEFTFQGLYVPFPSRTCKIQCHCYLHCVAIIWRLRVALLKLLFLPWQLLVGKK